MKRGKSDSKQLNAVDKSAVQKRERAAESTSRICCFSIHNNKNKWPTTPSSTLSASTSGQQQPPKQRRHSATENTHHQQQQQTSGSPKSFPQPVGGGGKHHLINHQKYSGSPFSNEQNLQKSQNNQKNSHNQQENQNSQNKHLLMPVTNPLTSSTYSSYGTTTEDEDYDNNKEEEAGSGGGGGGVSFDEAKLFVNGRDEVEVERGKTFGGIYRTILPANQPPMEKVRMLRDGLPLSYFEPLDTLQKLCETLDYSFLLDKAASCEEGDEQRRMLFVLAFVISQYAGTRKRLMKPFNPLLGGTYVIDRWNDRGWKYYAEQVGHSPDISAFHAIGKKGWTMSSSFLFNLSISLINGVEFAPVGRTEITIGDTTYAFNPINSTVFHLTNPEKRSVTHSGKIDIVSSKNEHLKASATFFGENNVKGQVYMEIEGTKPAGHGRDDGSFLTTTVSGQWSDSVTVSDGTVLYTVNEPIGDESVQFGFGQLARELNQIWEDMVKTLPRTDSRFRPDQRLFEEGRYEEARSEKKRLEQEQRIRRKTVMKDWVPLWFEKASVSPKNSVWTPNHKFWPAYHAQFKGVEFPPSLF